MGEVKGIKGQVKDHSRDKKALGIEATGRKAQRKDYGPLVDHDCQYCLDPVRAPELIKAVTCGRCAQRLGC